MSARSGGARQRSLAACSDDELMLLARAGDGEAFSALVRRHEARVVAVARKYVGEAAAGDVAQSAFLEIYRALPSYRPRGRFSSFLYRVLINQARMWSRSAKSRNAALDRWRQVVPPPSPSSRDALVAEERRRDVERAVTRLSRKLREVVILRFAGDLSYREIAALLDIPVGTVKSRLFAGLEKLARDVKTEDSV